MCDYSQIQVELIRAVDKIVKQQGFVKDPDDVKAVIRYLHRSFVPRKYLKKPERFKAAQKLLCSLKLFVRKSFPHDDSFFIARYDNIFHDYKNIFDEHKLPDLKQLFEVNCKIPDVTASYKSRDLAFEESLEDIRLQVEKDRLESRRRILRQFKGRKIVDKDIKVRFKLKKKYQDPIELHKDLYTVYQGWLESKFRAKTLYVDSFMQMAETYPSWAIRDPPTIDTRKKYYMSFERFQKVLLGKEACPKRFYRIMKFCHHILGRKPINLDTVNESILSQVLVCKEEEQGNVFKVTRPKHLYRFKLYAKFRKWLEIVVKDLHERGYLGQESAKSLPYGDPETLFLPLRAYKPIDVNVKLMIINMCMLKFLDETLEYPDEQLVNFGRKIVTRQKKKVRNFLSTAFIQNLIMDGWLKRSDIKVEPFNLYEIKDLTVEEARSLVASHTMNPDFLRIEAETTIEYAGLASGEQRHIEHDTCPKEVCFDRKCEHLQGNTLYFRIPKEWPVAKKQETAKTYGPDSKVYRDFVEIRLKRYRHDQSPRDARILEAAHLDNLYEQSKLEVDLREGTYQAT